jgi:hypothetical protein
MVRPVFYPGQTRIHIEHDASRRTATMNAVDPLAGQIGEVR